MRGCWTLSLLLCGCGGMDVVPPSAPAPAERREDPALPIQALTLEVVRETAPSQDPVLRWPDETVWREYWFPIDNAERASRHEVNIVDALADVRPGMRIADIGAGGGYFTFRYAARVGPTGEVVAQDIDRRMTLKVAWEAQARGVPHVTSVWIPRGTLALERERFDLVMFLDIGAFMRCSEDEARGYLTQSAQALRPGGRVLILQGMLNSVPDPACGPMSADEIRGLAGNRFTLTSHRTLVEADGTTISNEALLFTLR